MFIELTEIITNSRMASYTSKPKERLIFINVDKIQAFYSEQSSDYCTVEMRRQSIKVKESYETIKSKVV